MCVSISSYGYRLLVMLDQDALRKMVADWYEADPSNEAFGKVLPGEDEYSGLVLKTSHRCPRCDMNGKMVESDQRGLAANKEFVETMLNEYIQDLRESDVIEFSHCSWGDVVKIWREGCWF